MLSFLLSRRFRGSLLASLAADPLPGVGACRADAERAAHGVDHRPRAAGRRPSCRTCSPRSTCRPSLSAQLTGNVNGTFAGPAEKVLRDISRVYNLVALLRRQP